MIKNERQYRMAAAQAERFEHVASEVAAAGDLAGDTSSPLRVAELQGLWSQAESLRHELAEYDKLRSGRVRSFAADTLTDLPDLLIQARIARGLTQRELAERLGLKEQQVQRYESTSYASASLARLRAVADALDLSVREEVTLLGE
ncbi:MAG: helix-turn-helix transcriptional regulator [Ardenticatenales bacterium]